MPTNQFRRHRPHRSHRNPHQTARRHNYRHTFPLQSLHRGDRPTVYDRPTEPDSAAIQAPGVALVHSLAVCGTAAIQFGTLLTVAARYPTFFETANPGRVFAPRKPRAAKPSYLIRADKRRANGWSTHGVRCGRVRPRRSEKRTGSCTPILSSANTSLRNPALSVQIFPKK